MKLRNIKFLHDVLVDGAMRGRADSGTASALGVVIPSMPAPVLVPWHAVRWAEVDEAKEASPERKRGKPTP